MKIQKTLFSCVSGYIVYFLFDLIMTVNQLILVIKNEMKSLKIPSYFNGLLHYEEIELLTSYIESTGDPKRIDQPVNKDDIVIDDIIAENLMNLT